MLDALGRNIHYLHLHHTVQPAAAIACPSLSPAFPRRFLATRRFALCRIAVSLGITRFSYREILTEALRSSGSAAEYPWRLGPHHQRVLLAEPGAWACRWTGEHRPTPFPPAVP